MKKAFRLIVALLLVGGWGLAASALHVVWTGSSPILMPKDRLGVRDTYVNVAKWQTVEEVRNHPAVVQRLVATNRAGTLAHVFKAPSAEELAAQIQDALAKGPTTKPVDVFQKAHEVVEHARAAVTK